MLMFISELSVECEGREQSDLPLSFVGVLWSSIYHH